MTEISWLLDNIVSSDRNTILELHTDSQVRRYLGGPLDQKTAMEKADMYVSHSMVGLHWAVRETETLTLLGLVSITPHHDHQDSELSYQFSRTCHGLGLAYASVSTLIASGIDFPGQPRLIAETQSQNLPSIKLLERLGMKYERTVERFGAVQLVYGKKI